MKNLLFIPPFIVVCLMITIQATSANTSIAGIDSTYAELTGFSQQSDSMSIDVQSSNRNSQLKNSDYNCKAAFSDSTNPKMKIFVPDSSRTSSMPILKPAPLDQGIFVRHDNCLNSKSLN